MWICISLAYSREALSRNRQDCIHKARCTVHATEVMEKTSRVEAIPVFPVVGRLKQ